MSVKFEKETVTKVTEAATAAVAGKDDLLNKAGATLSKKGVNGYLAVSGVQLPRDRVVHAS